MRRTRPHNSSRRGRSRAVHGSVRTRRSRLVRASTHAGTFFDRQIRTAVLAAVTPARGGGLLGRRNLGNGGGLGFGRRGQLRIESDRLIKVRDGTFVVALASVGEAAI